MPRYFFDLYNAIDARDPEGLDLENLEAAKAQARAGASELIAESIAGGGRVDLDHRIEVRCEDGSIAYVLRFGDLVDLPNAPHD